MAATAMLRNHHWKYIHRVEGRSELYDMLQDPGELENLFGQAEYQAVVREMQLLLLNRSLQAGTPGDPAQFM